MPRLSSVGHLRPRPRTGSRLCRHRTGAARPVAVRSRRARPLGSDGRAATGWPRLSPPTSGHGRPTRSQRRCRTSWCASPPPRAQSSSTSRHGARSTEARSCSEGPLPSVPGAERVTYFASRRRKRRRRGDHDAQRRLRGPALVLLGGVGEERRPSRQPAPRAWRCRSTRRWVMLQVGRRPRAKVRPQPPPRKAAPRPRPSGGRCSRWRCSWSPSRRRCCSGVAATEPM